MYYYYCICGDRYNFWVISNKDEGKFFEGDLIEDRMFIVFILDLMS